MQDVIAGGSGREVVSTAALTNRLPPLVLAIGCGALLLCSAGARAEFVLNWSQQSETPAFFPDQQMTGCNQPPCVWHDVDVGNPGAVQNQSPFLYERLTLDGNTYYHMILGDPDSGFAQEVFIQVGGSNFIYPQGDGLGSPDVEGADGPLSGASSSSRGFSDGTTFDQGSQTNPLSQDQVFTGNTTGNPMRVQMRQLMTDGDLTVDFVKDRFLDKPNITNTIDTGEIRALFHMDSTGNRFDSMATPSVVTNTLEHLDPEVPEASAVFDMATDAQESSVTAGRYTYTPTTGVIGTNFGGAGGTYQYFDGGANLNPDWASFFDHREDNPWALPANRPTP
jgi:hypothetical protein